MIRIINIKSDEAIIDLSKFKNKKYVKCDVRFENVHLIMINNLMRYALFDKNDLFVNSDTLWSLMQEDEKKDNQHHHHGLTPEDILDALNNIVRPYCVFKTKQGRIAIILSCFSHFGEPLMAVIEIGGGIEEDDNANINKLITMYPKSNVDKLLDSVDSKRILYLNKLALTK